VALFDNSRVKDSEDDKILELLSSQENKNIIKILNKTDLPTSFEKELLGEFIELSTKY
jgi:tRNA modification GTPase